MALMGVRFLISKASGPVWISILTVIRGFPAQEHYSDVVRVNTAVSYIFLDITEAISHRPADLAVWHTSSKASIVAERLDRYAENLRRHILTD